jgi:DNA-directed RNA polymerase specialized sigma24 family protein
MDFSKDDDAQLLGYMADAEAEPEFAEAALGELLRRNAGYLYGVALRAYGRQVGGAAGVEALVNETFWKASRWAVRNAARPQAMKRFAGADADEVQRKVRLWLGRIVRNCFRDQLRGSEPADLLEDLDALSAPASSDGSPSLDGPLLERVRAAVEGLKAEDQEAIWVSLPFLDLETGQFAFPPGASEEVAKQLGIGVDTLRQRRHRARKRLRAALAVTQDKETTRVQR